MNTRMTDIPEHDRPREKLLRKGAAALSDQELVAVLLGKGTAAMDVMTLAGKLVRIVDEKGLQLRADDLTQYGGVGDAKAALILAAVEFARRRIKPEAPGLQRPPTFCRTCGITPTAGRSISCVPASTGQTRS